ncbi:hypothetical protein [Tolypothrix sp. VBCCA 56010]|uniref:phage adaptor protein n=1 Tax=Tolypothrix sp. VBCCA 56010 TaxID=3137731 RepID=UPI003D7E8BE3
MSMNAGQIIEMMKHALGAKPDPRLNLYRTLNSAGIKLVSAHRWSWLENAEALIQFAAGQESADLPADFVILSALARKGQGSAVRPVTLERIVTLRASSSSLSGGLVTHYAVSSRRLSSGAVVGTLHVWPTPSAAMTLSMVYQRGWADIADNDAGAVPGVPAQFFPALMHKARAEALLLENQTEGADEAAYQKELAKLIHEDGLRQIEIGPWRGGASKYERCDGDGVSFEKITWN